MAKDTKKITKGKKTPPARKEGALAGKGGKSPAKTAKSPAKTAQTAVKTAQTAVKAKAGKVSKAAPARKKAAKGKKAPRLPHVEDKTLTQIIAKMEEIREESLRVVNMHMKEDLKKREESGDVGDEVDQASSERDREFSLIIHQRHLRRLKQIEEAFERIEDGTYGLCEGTEEPIDPNRLLIMPLARFSLEYQQQQEKMLGRSPEDSLGGSEDLMISDE
ncbi:MAG: TraR/DksA family transcriptional regulator [SAR324 cluster bacterium]|nr:TraR/DksA family transcriptional regulator [SAR324 cluster bacterium]